jgi:hypothetical protein
MKELIEIPCVVRIEDGQPIVFYAQNKVLHCFNYKDGHNMAERRYMWKLPLAGYDTATRFVKEYNNKFDGVLDNYTFVLADRLSYK